MICQEKVDVIVFGATGFTGKYIVEECAQRNCFSWAIAGRNANKMRDILRNISSTIGIDVTNRKVIVADCDTPESLSKMAREARIVVNCTGPYRFNGESVVKACIEHGTHYLDITGEPEFMEKIQLKYHNLAQTNRSYIVNSCGMDSVPVDLGLLHFAKNFDGVVNFVEIYMKLTVRSKKHEPFVNYTTWECAVYSFINIQSLYQIRKKLFSKWNITKLQPKIPNRPNVHLSPVFGNKPCIPFPGSDRSVANRSQAYFAHELKLRPIQTVVYLVFNTTLVLKAISAVLFSMRMLMKYEFGRKLLLNYPQIFSLRMVAKANPTKETLETTSTEFRFYGEGWSKKKAKIYDDPNAIAESTDSFMMTRINIQDSAYNFTSMCVIQCALLLLNEISKLPSTGGVYTPASVFYRTNILEALEKNGATFQVVEKGSK